MAEKLEKQKYIKPYGVSVNPKLPDYVKNDALEDRMTQTQLGTIEDKYLIRDDDGNRLETVNDLYYRVAKSIAGGDKLYNVKKEGIEQLTKEFYELLSQNHFLPNSPTLMNAGRELGQLSACFVLPINDSMESIFQTIKDTAMIHKSGGGTGFTFSGLRPKKDRVSKTGRYAGGPISFLGVYDAATETVKQAGTRRGANWGGLRADHPDVYDWIFAKFYEGSFKNFNISIIVTDDFMNAVLSDDLYYLRDPRTKGRRDSNTLTTKKQFEKELEKIKNLKFSTLEERKESLTLPSIYLDDDEVSIICRYNGDKVGVIKNNEVAFYARKVFDDIVNLAWKNGEPGLVYIDTINKKNPTPHVGEIESTNPCGEQPLLPNESCNLGSINLAEMVKEEGNKYIVDWVKLKKTTYLATHFLNNVIEVNKYPLSQIEKITKENRKIGLGVMGFADMLIKLDIPYNSRNAVGVAEEIMKFISGKSFEESVKLAKERGEFPNFVGSIYDKKGKPKPRNATTTTIAPSGTISLAGGCSSGIEPLFNLKSKHVDGTGEIRYIVTPYLAEKLKKEDIDSKLVLEALDKGVSLQDMPLPRYIKDIFKTTNDLDWKVHLEIQRVFQKYTDNAVSKTINFSPEATRDDVYNAFINAWKMGIKGLTVYRTGSRQREVITKVGEEKKRLKNVSKLRPAILREEPIGVNEYGVVEKIFTITTYVEGKPTEFFMDTNFAIGEQQELIRWIAIRTSMDLRRGKTREEILEDVRDKIAPSGEKGPVPSGLGYFNRGIIDAIEAALMDKGLDINYKRLKELTEEMEVIVNKRKKKSKNGLEKELQVNSELDEEIFQTNESISGKICPRCREEINISGGCEVCACGSICG